MLGIDMEQASETPSTFKRDAVGLLTKDHRKMQRLFSEFDRVKDTADPSERFEIARQACGDLLIHMAIEEAFFYPMARQHIGDDTLMGAAATEHESAKELIRQIGEIDPADAMFAAKVTVLSEQMDLHIQDEESVMFPKVLVSDADLVALGEELLQAKNDMRVNLGLQPED